MHWYCITFACTFSANIALHMLAYTKVYETTDRAAKAGRSTLMEHCTCWLIPKSTKQHMGLAKQDDLPLWSTRKVNLNFNASSLCEVHFFFLLSCGAWTCSSFLAIRYLFVHLMNVQRKGCVYCLWGISFTWVRYTSCYL